MGMTQKHYNGLGNVFRKELAKYPPNCNAHRALVEACHSVGEWIESLQENPRYIRQQFVAACRLDASEREK